MEMIFQRLLHQATCKAALADDGMRFSHCRRLEHFLNWIAYRSSRSKTILQLIYLKQSCFDDLLKQLPHKSSLYLDTSFSTSLVILLFYPLRVRPPLTVALQLKVGIPQYPLPYLQLLHGTSGQKKVPARFLLSMQQVDSLVPTI